MTRRKAGTAIAAVFTVGVTIGAVVGVHAATEETVLDTLDDNTIVCAQLDADLFCCLALVEADTRHGDDPDRNGATIGRRIREAAEQTCSEQFPALERWATGRESLLAAGM